MALSDAGLVLGLDHVTLVVEDLGEAVATYETLFAQSCAGRGEGDGLNWALFAVANTALVLVAPHGEPTPLSEHIASPPAGTTTAIGALAFAVTELEHAGLLLSRRGLPAIEPAVPWLDRPAMPLMPASARGLNLLLTRQASIADPASAIRLDHVVIRSGDPERTLALLSGRLGLELRLDRSNPAWGTRLLFFRCGDLVVEVSHDLAAGITDAPDSAWGMTWRVPDIASSHARLEATGIPVSPLRVGRKPETRIFTIRDHAAGVPTAFIGV
jgi:catechol 2,3-dioxygenase-like lactoylglutathione lyase family enzyme